MTIEKIASTEVGSGGVSTITFSSIPQTYKDLKILMSLRSDRAATADTVTMQFNSDTGSNYNFKVISGTSTVTSANSTSQSFIECYRTTGASTASNIFANSIIYIPTYTSSNPKILSVENVTIESATNGIVTMVGAYWNDTSAITDITFDLTGGGSSTNFVQYSSITIYGIQ